MNRWEKKFSCLCNTSKKILIWNKKALENFFVFCLPGLLFVPLSTDGFQSTLDGKLPFHLMHAKWNSLRPPLYAIYFFFIISNNFFFFLTISFFIFLFFFSFFCFILNFVHFFDTIFSIHISFHFPIWKRMYVKREKEWNFQLQYINQNLKKKKNPLHHQESLNFDVKKNYVFLLCTSLCTRKFFYYLRTKKLEKFPFNEKTRYTYAQVSTFKIKPW